MREATVTGRAVGCGLLALLLFAGTAWSEPAVDPLATLLRQARHWQARGRPDKSVPVWLRVLRSAPDHHDALAALAVHHARAGRVKQARVFRERLAKLTPDHPELAPLDRMLELGNAFGQRLERARESAARKRADEARRRYRALFGPSGPPTELALEYWQTIGGDEEGWEEARAALSALARRDPGENAWALALARHLTYREETRREGIDRLEALLTDSESGAEARRSIHDALKWLQPKPDDAALLERWARREPENETLSRTLTELRGRVSGAALGQALQAAHAALGSGRLETAERLFRELAERNTRDARAWAGLGLVALRREDFEEAKSLLLRARALAPAAREQWAEPLLSATFWSHLRRAEGAHDEEQRRQALEAAISTGHPDAHLARLRLVRAQLAAGEAASAERGLQAVLSERPKDGDALRALVDLLIQTGRFEEAERADARLRAVAPALAFPPGALAGERLRLQALEQSRAGHTGTARRLLHEARMHAPRSPWLLHDLVQLELGAGNLIAAREALDALAPLELPSEVRTSVEARVLAAEGRDAEALRLLAVPDPASLGPDLLELRKSLTLKLELRRIRKTGERDRSGAIVQLSRLEKQTPLAPAQRELVAETWSALGETQRAIEVLSSAIDDAVEGAAGLRLTLASLLLRQGAEDETARVLRELEETATLLDAERAGLFELQVALAVRRSDRLRESGRLAGAWEQLAPLVKRSPDHARLVCALARLYQARHEHARALALFREVVARHPEDREARDGLIDAALSAGELALARQAAADALERSPREPRLLLTSARVDVRAGDDARAFERLRLAWEELALGRAPERRDADRDALFAAADQTFGAAPAVDPDAALRREIAEEAARLQERNRPEASAALRARRREGEQGLGQLSELALPVSVDVPISRAGRLRLQVTGVLLDAGTLDGSDAARAQRFGSGAIPQAPAPQATRGAALALGWRWRWLDLEVGSTPLGFAVPRVVGALAFAKSFERLSFRVELARRAVTDSVLSWSGTLDPGTGALFGGVVRQGARAELSWELDPVRVHAFGGASLLSGEAVLDNNAAELGGGASWRIHRGEELDLFGGLSVYAMGYRSNLRHFTLGHGGYFSPQEFVHAGVPLALDGRRDRLSWELAAEPGLNWFQEEETAHFPGQAPSAVHPARTDLGFALNVRSRIGYRINDAVAAELRLDLHRASDYQQVTVGLGLDYGFGGPTLGQ